jgi:SAM-dependent MidA family methyltransferase
VTKSQVQQSSAASAPAEAAIRDRIKEHGPLTFAEFMSLALHDPAVGYYSRPQPPLGQRGDYYTSPELHPGFAALLGRQIAQLWRALDRPGRFVVQESGPGRGLFVRDLLDCLREQQPELYQAIEYRLDERSLSLRLEQERRLHHAGHGAVVRWVDGFQEPGGLHCILANELLDALPVHLVQARKGELRELYVAIDTDGLGLREGPLSTPAIADYFERLGLRPTEGARAEVNLAALDWMRAAGAALERGLLLVLDYGYPADLLYGPGRPLGTLLCYYQHTLNSDPLRAIGQQDITAHVDFTSVRRAGEESGLETLGLVSQRRLLTNLGWNELRASIQRLALPQMERTANQRALDALLDPEGLGRVLALVQQRSLDGFGPLGLVGGPPVRWAHPPLRSDDHLALIGPEALDALPDFEAQWAELWAEADED